MGTLPSARLRDRSLRRLCVEFRRRQRAAYVTFDDSLDEPDVRLTVRRTDDVDPPAHVLVELLPPGRDRAPVRHWAAVRVEDGRRQVWRGPDAGCPGDAVVAFVDALLAPQPPRTEQPYTLLG